MLRYGVLCVGGKACYLAITMVCMVSQLSSDEIKQVFLAPPPPYLLPPDVPEPASGVIASQEEPEPAKIDPRELMMTVYSRLKGRVLDASSSRG